jgi:hypothetical protein
MLAEQDVGRAGGAGELRLEVAEDVELGSSVCAGVEVVVVVAAPEEGLAALDPSINPRRRCDPRAPPARLPEVVPDGADHVHPLKKLAASEK